ncbi:Retrovirus-related Pol polyprotein from transposon RE1 [Vitis vinifera]|uniref:Retrovirus-related Pol polyprotein from transposon RE1 n=1 Tax=Vitis vinifera TaxID=29760 RepID=A0A438J6S2_VITVI|nr:Retrovirus-related Pol polyprotein from transposon RE1 [Vitis vinifera]
MLSQLPLPSFADIIPKALSHEIFERSMYQQSINSGFYAQRNNSTRPKSTKSGKPKPSTASASKSSPSSPAFATYSIPDSNDFEWYPDSGATSHLTNDPEGVDVPVVYSGNERVMVFSTTVYLINRLPSQTLDGKTPYELLFGYSPLHKGFRCFYCKTQHLYVSRHVQFHETIFPYAGDDMKQIHNSTPYITFSDSFESNDNMSPNLLLSSPVSNPNCLPCNDDLHASSHASLVISTIPSSSPLSPSVSIRQTSTNTHPMVLLAIQEPRGFRSGAKHPEWLLAMDDEIQALKKNDTWDLVPRPINHNMVGCRWIFKTKLHANGSIERHKARLVVKGFSQIHGLDFEDTFSHVVDSSLFVHHTTTDIVYLLLYVDDMVLTSTNPASIKTLITRQSKEFAMKDLGSLHYFLGVEVQHNSQGLFLSQTKYALDLLQCADMIKAKPISTPFVVGQHLSTTGKLFSNPTIFRSLVGALQYLTITRPDFSFSIVHHGLQLHRTSSHELLAYSDADWVGCPDTQRSTSGYLIFFGANLVSWCSKKQSTVSCSSAEAEYRSLAITTAEVAWIVQLLRDLRLPLPSPPKILCDNKSALFMAFNLVTRSRSKHIAIDYHFVRELIANGSIKVAFTSSHLQLVDSFTKGVSKPQFLLFHNKLHVIPSTTLSLQGGDKAESSPD